MLISYYLRLAWRRCRLQRGMTFIVVLTIAVGVAACLTTATIFAALEGEPLPGVSNHLYVSTVDAREKPTPADSAYSKPDSLLKLRDAMALVDAHQAAGQVALTQTYPQVSTIDNNKTTVVNGLMAYGPVVQVFGVPLRSGREWSQSEQTSHAPVAVIDSDLAEKLLGTEQAVGQSISINGHAFQIVGVTAPWRPRTQFLGAAQQVGGSLPSNTQIFLPLGAALDAGVGPVIAAECDDPNAATTFGSVNTQLCRWLELWINAETPEARSAFQTFLANYAQTQHSAGRFAYSPNAALYSTQDWMGLNHVIPNDVSLNLLFAGAFLLLCMVNVAGLLTARFLRRKADVAIRRALGASVRTIFAQHLTESGLMGLAGGTLALPLTWMGMWIVRKQPVGYAPVAEFSAWVFVSLVLLSLLVGMLVGIIPAWRVCALPPAMQIKES